MLDLSFKSETAKKRHQQVLRAIDRVAARDQLAFLTTKRVSNESGISDGVLFRIFTSKESMIEAWILSRCEYLKSMTEATPVGYRSLHVFIQSLLNDSIALSFLCCHPIDTPYLRQNIEIHRGQFRCFLSARIGLMVDTSLFLSADALTDHLIQSIYRAWDPENLDRSKHKEQLMNKLPWEQEASKNNIFPEQKLIQRLALNDSGFVFDPENGRSFTANTVGLYILRFLQENNNPDALLTTIQKDFDVDGNDAERDTIEFAAQLRKFLV